MKKKFLVAFLAVGFFAVMALPTQGAKYTLTSLGDQLAKIVKQVKNLKMNGTLPAQYVTYDRSKSGLKSRTVQDALDEVGVKLSKLVTGTLVRTTGFRSSALEPTTWTGIIYDVCTGDIRNSNVTVTFTAVDASTGSWVSTPYNVFNAGAVCFLNDTGSDGKKLLPTGTYTGSYKIVNDTFLIYGITKPSDESIDAKTNYKWGFSATVDVKGHTLTLTDTRTNPHAITVLTPQ